MAYGEGGENARLLMRTIKGVADFSGRSQRTEVVYYWIAVTLLGVVISFISLGLLPFKARSIVDQVIGFILIIPMFALFSRRLHDQNRSGWWALLLPISISLSIPNRIGIWSSENENLGLATGNQAIGWLILILSLATLVLLLLPGTIGPNAYGDDPREGGA